MKLNIRWIRRMTSILIPPRVFGYRLVNSFLTYFCDYNWFFRDFFDGIQKHGGGYQNTSQREVTSEFETRGRSRSPPTKVEEISFFYLKSQNFEIQILSKISKKNNLRWKFWNFRRRKTHFKKCNFLDKHLNCVFKNLIFERFRAFQNSIFVWHIFIKMTFLSYWVADLPLFIAMMIH